MSKATAWTLLIGILFSFCVGIFVSLAAIGHEPDEYSGLKIISIFLPWTALSAFPFYTAAAIIELLTFFKRPPSP